MLHRDNLSKNLVAQPIQILPDDSLSNPAVGTNISWSANRGRRHSFRSRFTTQNSDVDHPRIDLIKLLSSAYQSK